MGKSKELGEAQRNVIVDLHKLGKSLGAISRELRIPRSSVQTVVRKFKQLGCVATLPRSGRRPALSLSDQWKLVLMFRIDPGTTLAQAHRQLQAAGVPASLSTVKRTLRCHGLGACRARRKLRVQKPKGSGTTVRVQDEPEVETESPGPGSALTAEGT